MGHEMRVGVLGAAGMVGGQLLRLLEEKALPLAELRLFATARSAGLAIPFAGEKLTVEEVGPGSFRGLDFAFFCATAEAAREHAPMAADAGCVVIDKSRAFRMDPDVPLAVPEVNPQALRRHRGIIASPNCSTIQLVMALNPLHRAAGIRRVVVATYQSVSGTGREAVAELRRQAEAFLAGREGAAEVYPQPIAFNLFPHIDEFGPHGYSGEEVKLVEETRKILEAPGLRLTATTVRVPVFVGHAEAVNVELDRRVTRQEALDLLRAQPGLVLVEEGYPTPLAVAGSDDVFVGRVREDASAENALDLWVVADNLRKGAATNAVQIAQFLWKGSPQSCG
ncbi:MAG: aspartate-semialdehyde dehydrogenase [bacterium]|nr:aspartate-semialdehyde dehydrogenase [bacterium]